MNKAKIKKYLRPIIYPLRALFFKYRYALVLRRLRKQYGKRKIKVGFLVSELSKWKGQTVYELMSKTHDFEPVMLIYPSPLDIQYDNARIDEILKEKENYFRRSGMHVRNIWDRDKQKSLPSSEINVDIVFYQQTWDIPPAPLIGDVSRKSLSFYFPYYMVSEFIPRLDLEMYLHYCIYRYVLLNEDLICFYKRYIKAANYTGKMVGLGHPCIDMFHLKKDYQGTKNYVIYAPHFSFKCDRPKGKELYFYSSTFLEYGKIIFNYAKNHPEINWVFKPHPRLRTELTCYNVWSKKEVDDYFQSWEEIGVACYDSHYIDLFLESKAMITDCCSFLTEYSCTGKPLIRLIPDHGKTLPPPNPALKKLQECFYKVFNEVDLFEFLDMVVLQDKDPNREDRLKCVREAHLTDNYAAQNITEYIRELLTQ